MKKLERERPRHQLHFDEPSKTKQSMAAECDINNIMAKYRATGLVDHVARYGGQYGFLPDETDYQTNLESVREAREAFESLPSKIRTQFENDPAKFLGFVLDPANKAAVAELGLGPDSDAMPAAPAPAPTTEPTEPGTAAEPA